MDTFIPESRAIISLVGLLNSSIMAGVQPGPPSPPLWARSALSPSQMLVNRRPPPLPPVSCLSDPIGLASGLLDLATNEKQSYVGL
jgi:hypothetical protein